MPAAVSASISANSSVPTGSGWCIRSCTQKAPSPPTTAGSRPPARDRLDPAALRRAEGALATVLGVEALIALRNVLGLDDREVEDVIRFACRAIVRAALEA